VKQPLTPGRKADILRTFYRMTVGPIFPDAFVPTPYGMDQTTGGMKESCFNIHLTILNLIILVPKRPNHHPFLKRR